MLIQHSKSKAIWRIADYFYRNKESKQLCRINQLEWNQQIHVSIILAIQQQGYWVQYFLHQVNQYYQTSHDEYFSVVLVDFGSTDIDIPALLRSSSFKKIQLVQLGRKHKRFSRSAGINAGVQAINNRRSIIVAYDLHLNLPLDLIDNVRKRCFPGKTVYMPILLRLHCNASPNDPNGEWEEYGFGIMALYREDFLRIGGYNASQFRYRWGGEDSAFLNQLLYHHYDIERVCHPKLYHHFHRRLPWKKGTVDDFVANVALLFHI
ncbi:uncharacterized protein TRIADDRAFT_32537 [Trichoplax adhaerens]|uniref:Galactosyltransferase C-terminal domain-containing protein n=1 Tax=Trichoplax adhaerens TaxID=10228 RepID=B3SB85_TRIAD|nr:hypothetical protein TRIADDRAFT_32537 [Trichoplax adhaerens]EDV20122.1 hypothetical protein TRIADDRAFT_32537 [Trichoplax adhaerens]|eukprot:XP_002117506.1 hypothetical protein TRIADDRAFT_32537 [Trichoplax adhaerens]